MISEIMHADVPGAEIDFRIERGYRVINVCEAEFAGGGFDFRLRNKTGEFRLAAKVRDAIHHSMIIACGVKKNQYSSIIHNRGVRMDVFVPQ